MGHDEGTPLVATYKTQRPPWIGLWSSREYKGRPDWWKEAGVRDDVVRSGKLRLVRHRYKEEDPVFFDPKVPDGTSNSGPIGLDSMYHNNITIKADQPGSLEDFQTKMWKSSHQYKNIVEKFDISRNIRDSMLIRLSASYLTLAVPKWELGRGGFFTNHWYHFGPRFFEKPLNEAAHEKGLAMAKYTAMLTFIWLSWGVSLSAAATYRNKDDVKNHLFASAALGATLATMKDNIPLGITAAIMTLVVGTFWQYARVSENGLYGLVGNPGSGGGWGGPVIWKGFRWGDAEVPKTRY
ncbi:hypothetical protein OSTOST_26021 [Ostertagia ostertagi]